jgi:phosphate transport system substrate-binding protein
MQRAARACFLAAVAVALASCPAASKKPVAAPVTAPGPVPRADAPLAIAGSGSNIPLTQLLLDAYAAKRGRILRIPPSIGTAGAVEALKAGKLDLGLISRPLKQGELEAGIREVAYARIGIVLAVHPAVPDSSLTSGELVGIYEGTKSRWVNGSNIIVLCREAGDSSNAVLEKVVPGFKRALASAFEKKRWEVYYTDAEENDAIASTPNSFGLSDTVALARLGNSIKSLRLDGAEPSLGRVLDGSYPLRKDLRFAFMEPLSAEARAFIDFALSAEGRKIVSGSGAVPLGKD